MRRIAPAHVVEAVRAVGRLNGSAQVQLGEEIFAHQPHLLGCVLALRHMGASDAQIGIALHVLFVAWWAMKASGHRWPVISQDDQDLCLQRLIARLRFVEGLPPKRLRQAVKQHIHEHTEPQLLAFAYGHLRESGVLGARNEAEKYVLLAALNIVECIAFAGRPTVP
jgi:hypothetical protein